MSTTELTKGNPIKLMLLFMFPLFIGNIFQQIYSLADTVIVGNLIGIKALAAVGCSSAIVWLVLGFILGITSGFSVLTAQRFGAQDYKNLKQSVVSSIYLCVFFTIIITFFSCLTAKWLLVFMNTPKEIFEDAFDYIFIIYLGTFATVFYNMISNIIRALGDSKTPLIFLIIASIINIFLDIIFIAVFKYGVASAALATVLSQIVSGALCLVYIKYHFPILHLKKEDWKINKEDILNHFKVGFPMGFQMSVLTIGMIAVQVVLNSFGSESIAAFTAACKVEQLAVQPLVAVGVTVATYVAQNFGALEFKRIRFGIKICSNFILFFSISAGILILLYGKFLIALFLKEKNVVVINLAQEYLSNVILFYFPLGMLIMYRSALQGMGNSIIPLYSGVLELIMRTLAVIILSKYFGYLGVCLAGPAAWFSGAVLLTIGYYKTFRHLIFKLRKSTSKEGKKVLV